jgi:hypothetical protein
MLKTAALITALALTATGSVAMASPSRTFEHRARPARVAFDHRASRPTPGWGWNGAGDDAPRHYRATWVSLSSPVRVSRVAQGCIEVSDPGTFTQLRLQNAGGVARIDRVIVRFADGGSQIAALGSVLDASGELVEIPLDGNNRRIDSITVIGAPGSRGNVQVFAI